MRMPDSLSSLVDEGIIEEVLRPLMSGKEAQIYLVVAGGIQRVAKIYKEAQNRSFKHRADYTEGRKVRNTRDQRAIDKRSKHGKGQNEAAWRSTEVDMIYRLQAAGVRVPAPYQFIDGVLIMELVTGPGGLPAPRLGEVNFTPEEATAIYERLLREVVRMLCAGVVHGDLSDFNVLLGADGPVIIDLPQAVDPSKNQNARMLLLRDVENLHRFVMRCAPATRRLPYAEEMWALFESNQLTPETVLRGQYRGSQKKANTEALLELVGEVNEDERRRREAKGLAPGAVPPRPRRVEVIIEKVEARGKKPALGRGPRLPLSAGHDQQRAPQAAHAAGAARAVGARAAAPQRGARPERSSAPAAGSEGARPSSPLHDRGPARPRAAFQAAPSQTREPLAQTADSGLAVPARRRRRRRPRSVDGAAPRHDAPSAGVAAPADRESHARPAAALPQAHTRSQRTPIDRPQRPERQSLQRPPRNAERPQSHAQGARPHGALERPRLDTTERPQRPQRDAAERPRDNAARPPQGNGFERAQGHAVERPQRHLPERPEHPAEPPVQRRTRVRDDAAQGHAASGTQELPSRPKARYP